MSQVRDSPRRYKLGADGQPHRSWYGKLPEEFTPEDTLRFMAETDLQLNGTIETDTLAVIHAAGYDYQDGAIVPRPGKENGMAEHENGGQTPEAAPLKLDVSVRPIAPMGNLLGFANVKFNDCFVVEDFKIIQTEKGLYVGMPSKPDRSSSTGYRDTAKPITREFRKELHGAILNAYSAEVERLQNVAAAQERPSIKSQLEAGAKEVAKTDAAKMEAVNADVAKTDAAKESAAKAPKRKATKGAER